MEKQACFVEGLSQARGPDGLALVSDANLINIRSSRQLQTLLFGGSGKNSITGEVLDAKVSFPAAKQPGKKAAAKFDLHGLGLTPVNKRKNFTAVGNPSASGAVLQDFAGACSERPGLAYQQLLEKGVAHEQAEMITGALRSLEDAKRTITIATGFARPMLEYGKHAGRIHPEWKFDTSTGRLACRRPNLQNLPSGGNDVYSIRSAFKASPGKTLIIADYSQLEMRVLAHMSNCPLMIEKLTKGGDYHSEVTAEMFDYVAEAVALQQVVVNADAKDASSKMLPTIKEKFNLERQKAKAINFSIIYGKEAATLGEDLQISKQEAEGLIEAWYASKPEVKIWRQEVIRQCSHSKSALSLLGRVRTLPLIDVETYRRKSQRAAVNYVIQGSAADVVLAAMLRIWKNEKLKELGFRLVLQVHDEFVLEGPETNSSEAAKLLQEMMACPFGDHQPRFKFRVPLSSDVVIGQSFGKA
jgi:DNA polymerase-1